MRDLDTIRSDGIFSCFCSEASPLNSCASASYLLHFLRFPFVQNDDRDIETKETDDCRACLLILLSFKSASQERRSMLEATGKEDERTTCHQALNWVRCRSLVFTRRRLLFSGLYCERREMMMMTIMLRLLQEENDHHHERSGKKEMSLHFVCMKRLLGNFTLTLVMVHTCEPFQLESQSSVSSSSSSFPFNG